MELFCALRPGFHLGFERLGAGGGGGAIMASIRLAILGRGCREGDVPKAQEPNI